MIDARMNTILELTTTKGGEPRSVPINRRLKEALQECRGECRNRRYRLCLHAHGWAHHTGSMSN